MTLLSQVLVKFALLWSATYTVKAELASKQQILAAYNKIHEVGDQVDTGSSIGKALAIVADAIKNQGIDSQMTVEQVDKIVGAKTDSNGEIIAPPSDMVSLGRTQVSGRQEIGISDPLALEPLFGYGCWCFFGRIDSNLGRGPPVDQYDAVCQKLTLCYRCIFVDAENEGDEDCDPFTADFNASIDLNSLFNGGGVQNATTSCKTDNQNACQWRTCSCAMTMITSFFNLSFDSQNVYDDNLRHKNGFDYQLECPMQGKSEDRQCCGYYPSRRTYDRKSTRACCHEKSIFNPLRHVCCDDGTHIGLGKTCSV